MTHTRSVGGGIRVPAACFRQPITNRLTSTTTDSLFIVIASTTSWWLSCL